MHYSVHVIHPKTDQSTDTYINEVMAPYDENLEVEPYRVYISRKTVENAVDWAKKQQRNYKTTEELLTWYISYDVLQDKSLDDPNIIDHDDDKLTDYYYVTQINPQGHWDYWVIGGRWADYFGRDSKETVTVQHAIEHLNDPTHGWQVDGPYVYVTLTGEWIPRELYNPDGEGYDGNDPNSIFPPNEAYDYKNYLTTLAGTDMLVTVVDIHS